MPSRFWRHTCCGSNCLSGSPQCRWCGGQGEFAGWHLSMWEAVRNYHYVYELNPFGPHRPYADRTLGALRDRCVCCNGDAVVTIDMDWWSYCPTCEGTGGVWSGTFAEVEAARQRVLARWPGAALPWVDARTRREQEHD